MKPNQGSGTFEEVFCFKNRTASPQTQNKGCFGAAETSKYSSTYAEHVVVFVLRHLGDGVFRFIAPLLIN